MEVGFPVNAIRFKTKGFFYQGERKVKFLEFRKPKDPAVQKRARKTMRDLKSWANRLAEGKYRLWLGIAATKYPPDAPKLKWLEPKLEGVRTGVITPETIRDDLVNAVLERMNEDDE
ncbi:uncharacterized protein LOC133728597 [Rosa rugosa]|uniref:uncharacterized protein LOC133728597 n=1 Tax=Rosa rugosa TaxID=74645 RepID=UPI002B4057E7|nr:uncharacterized protein LOC133728597 [Rosa rugosa]